MMDILCWVVGGLCFSLLMLNTIADIMMNPLSEPQGSRRVYCPDAPQYGPEDDL